MQDDLVWWAATVEEHKEQIEVVFAALSAEKIHLHPKKMNLFCRYTRYLGCVVGNDSLSMDPRKVEVVANMAAPTDFGGVRQLIGCASFYSHPSSGRGCSQTTSRRRSLWWWRSRRRSI